MARVVQLHDPLPWRHVHFVGVGGVGMAGLAHILADLGVAVTGTDAADSAMLATLAARGLAVRSPHGETVPEGADLVVFSNAVPAANAERQDARARGIPSCLRGEFLALLATRFPVVVSVAGSHGKTTTTAMLAHILLAAGLEPGFLVGASVPGWPRAAQAGGGRILVTEVDESDGTQALMRSTHAIVVNVEDDHCWSLGGIEALEECFRTLGRHAEHLIAWDSPATRRLFADHGDAAFLGEDSLPPEVPMPGRHNRIDAALALAAATRLGVERSAGLATLRSFPGVDRRLSVRCRCRCTGSVLVEDYAHHPTELRATLSALREAYPAHRLHVVFQPHRFERVLRYGAEFAAELSRSDRAVVYRPFAAWREDAALADPAGIARAVQGPPVRYATEGLGELARRAAREALGAPTVVAVVGAGDIHALVPLLGQQLAECETAEVLERARARGCPAAAAVASWAELTTLGVVGTARPVLLEPRNDAELLAALALARDLGLPLLPLGRGSNLVGTDRSGTVLAARLGGEFAAWNEDGGQIRVGAAVSPGRLARDLARLGRCPDALAALAWIPGSVGAAVRMNAGAEGFDLSGLVRRVRGIRLADGIAATRANHEIRWEYRETDLDDLLVTTVWFDLPPAGDPARQERLIQEHGERRRARLPAGRSAGSVFRNPPGDSAGRLLELCGCKGLRIGGAEVSRRHANVFTADPGTREADFAELVRVARERARAAFGVSLDLEIQFVGDLAEA